MVNDKHTDIELAAAALEAARLADKELFATQIKYERELREVGDRNERELREAREQSEKLARELQAAEDSRHFDRLNHEAAQLKAMQTTYWPREVAENQMAEFRKQIGEQQLLQSRYATKEDIAPINDYIARNQGRGSGFQSVWGWVLGVAMLVGTALAVLARMH